MSEVQMTSVPIPVQGDQALSPAIFFASGSHQANHSHSKPTLS
jgi:hypothetical protein